MEKLMTEEQVAEALCLNPEDVKRMTQCYLIPHVRFPVGGEKHIDQSRIEVIRYDPEQISFWIQEHTVKAGSL